MGKTIQNKKMINIRNTSSLIAAIACAANALNLQSSASASSTYT